jgi:hypothetical protein
MDHDRLGRRRGPGQERGLRPLHPILPDEWISRVLRVAMSESDWERFEALADAYALEAPSQARAHGMALSNLLHSVPAPRPEPGPLDWMDWERRKTLRLLLKKSS